MFNNNLKEIISSGDISLGVEFGSTRIKAVLTAVGAKVIAKSSYEWENQFIDGIFTYDLEEVWIGLRKCYKDIALHVKQEYDVEITKISSIGFSAMMHGYLVFDKQGDLLVPFRTWRNTTTEQSAYILSELFNFNIPQRWSIAHLYQSILNKESHVGNIDFLTTLSGYVHWKITGERVIGIGDASGIFPIDENTLDYNKNMIKQFKELAEKDSFTIPLKNIFPKVLLAGQWGGRLTKEGAALIDPTGILKEGSLVCPPEGDAGTGMVATNSIKPKTGNISAGTSIFAMIVLEKNLSKYYSEIDIVTTPVGHPVAMVHCNTCTSDIDAWVKIFYEFAKQIDKNVNISDVYNILYQLALNGNFDCGGLVSVNYFSGEPVVNIKDGLPLFIRKADNEFNLSNFMRTHIYSSFATVKIGLDLLFNDEKIKIDKLLGHGGLFKIEKIAQQMLASSLNTSVEVTNTGSEGGAWGMAILAEYISHKEQNQSLQEYLNKEIFVSTESIVCYPNKEETEGFNSFLEKYKKTLQIEKFAVEM
ncbi:MAG: FGGY-family carbohydrate kinase [Tissierellia bacterium]|nr:FGGY-family carbohydrate kinase [Tissierellia bacterium]MDD4780545.1 FGGY-family carbohydrate kinase [Tissierellia bacterium]